MQRQLTTTAKAPRHPMRRMLPPAAPLVEPAAAREEDELKLFALSFTAFFICIYTLIF